MTVKLDYNKARNKGYIVDYKKYMSDNGVVNKTITAFPEDIQQPMKLYMGSPLVVCVEGTYILADRLVDICINGKPQVNMYIASLHNTTISAPFINFKWQRGDR